MLAVGHGEGQYQMSKNSHAKAEMLTPDDEWYPVEDYPYGVLHYSRPGIVFHMVFEKVVGHVTFFGNRFSLVKNY